MIEAWHTISPIRESVRERLVVPGLLREDRRCRQVRCSGSASLGDDDLARIELAARSEPDLVGRLVSRDARAGALVISFVKAENQGAMLAEVPDCLDDELEEARSRYPELDCHVTGDIILNRTVNAPWTTACNRPCRSASAEDCPLTIRLPGATLMRGDRPSTARGDLSLGNRVLESGCGRHCPGLTGDHVRRANSAIPR